MISHLNPSTNLVYQEELENQADSPQEIPSEDSATSNGEQKKDSRKLKKPYSDLLQTLLEIARNDSHGGVRNKAIEQIGKIPTQEAVSALIQLYDELNELPYGLKKRIIQGLLNNHSSMNPLPSIKKLILIIEEGPYHESMDKPIKSHVEELRNTAFHTLMNQIDHPLVRDLIYKTAKTDFDGKMRDYAVRMLTELSRRSSPESDESMDASEDSSLANGSKKAITIYFIGAIKGTLRSSIQDRLTISAALLEMNAGENGDLGAVEIRRLNPKTQYRDKYAVDFQKIMDGKSEDMNLLHQDIVYVPSLLLPETKTQKDSSVYFRGTVQSVLRLNPGEQKTLSQAIMEINVGKFANLKKVELKRMDTITQRRIRYEINVEDIIENGDPDHKDMILMNSDIITIKEKIFEF
ncbi:MAG TPA: HEAT repeat domain-containing protein [Verrucomicrobiales bacterium]|nr:HEAT repeat domain-containing protein [Verrucomicrobiales bacterium]